MNITYIYTSISYCCTSIWHRLSRGTVNMQSKWLFRWKIRAIAFYLERFGFKSLIRSQVKISLVLLSFLRFVHITQPLLNQALPDKMLKKSLQRMRILPIRNSGVLSCIWRKNGMWKGRNKNEKNSKFSVFVVGFLCNIRSQFLSVILTS